MEMLIVVTLLGLLAGITFPSVTAGIESVRLASGADSFAAFLSGALNRADRLQEVVELEIAPAGGLIAMRSSTPGFERRLELPDRIRMRRVLPEIPGEPQAPRRILLYPGGAVPQVAVELVNGRGAIRTVMIDPITGVPRIQRGEAQ